MIYVVVKPKTGTDIKLVCIVKASDKEQALKMVGTDEQSAQWGLFTDDELSAMNVTKEGYVSASM